MGQEALWTKHFASLFICNFFLFANYYFLLVTMPIYAIHDLHVEESLSGLVSAVFLAAAIIVRFASNPFVERCGKLLMLRWSLIIFLVSSILYLFSHGLLSLLAIRFLHGLGFGIATMVGGALVADIVPSTRQGEGMGYFVLSSNLAMVAGPFFGLFSLERLGAFWMLIIALVCTVASFLSALSIRSASPQAKQSSSKRRIQLSLKQMIEPSVLPLAFIGALFALTYAPVLSFVSVYAKSLHLGESSNLFFVIYAAVLLVSRPFTGRWFDAHGPKALIVFCTSSFAVGLFLLSIAKTSEIFLLSAALIGMGWGNLFPVLQTMAIQSGPLSRSSSSLGTFLSFFDVGISAGSFLTGVLMASIGFRSLYAGDALFLLAVFALYFAMIEKRRKHEHRHAQQQQRT
ncbi:MFS transporter [Geobacillus jurassicus]|uniref:MFS transporter n=1 Tax=Geobacillus jurassicus TaxID=235932 RepID=A0ABV6GN44_9BACL|nr:MFS transporter [Geobacillus jurassicus]